MRYKRFLLISFSDYYPSGGLGDVWKQFDTPEEWQSFIKSDEYREWCPDYAYVFDCDERTVVWGKE